MIVMVDNYDSFAYNLVQYLGELGQKLIVFRNDCVTISDIERIKPSYIVISPGPGRPDKAGISEKVIKSFYKKVPILGVCLGHQAIAEVFGAKIVKARRLMHGKTSLIYHNGRTIFKKIPSPFIATRYHSLIVENSSVPDCLEINAWTEEDEIMGIKHKKYPDFGEQFHPESILTEVGKEILKNFLYL